MRDIIVRTLESLSPELNKVNDDFFVIGGAALLLLGVPIGKTHDLDILTSIENVKYLKSAWKQHFISEPILKEDDKFSSYFCQFTFPEILIEVQGGLKVKVKGEWIDVIVEDYEEIELNGITIKTPTLQEMIRILTLFDREKDHKRIQSIKDYLENQSV